MTDEAPAGPADRDPTVARWWAPQLMRSRFVRDVSGTFGANVVSALLSLAQSIVVARALGARGKGIIAFGILLPSTAILLVDAGFTASNIYFATRASKISLLRNALAFTITASAVVSLTLVAIRALGAGLFRDLPTAAFFVAVGLVPLLLVVSQLSALLIGIGDVLYANATNIFQAAVTFLLTFVAVHAGLGATAILAAVGVSALFSALLLARKLLHGGAEFSLRWDRPLLAQQLRFGIRDHAGNLVQFLNYRLDQFIVTAYLGAGALGIYSVSVAIAETLWMVPQAAGVLLFARAARVEPERLDQTTPILLRWTVVLSVAGGLGLALFGRAAIILLYSNAFASAYTALLLLLPGAVALGPAKVLTGEIAGRGHPGLNSLVAAVGAVATIALDMTLIPLYGIRGAAAASSASYILVAGLSWYCQRKLRRLQHGRPNVVVV